MRYELKVRPEASADIAEAFSWYEDQRPGLGGEFEEELNRTFGYITYMPLAGRPMSGSVRRALMRRFPFSVYYDVTGALIEVRAVLHYRRRPRKLFRRA